MQVVLMSAFSIIGLHRVVDSLLWTYFGNGLNEYWDMMEGKWYRDFLKPLMFCSLCMSSVWGTIFYFVYSITFYQFGDDVLFNWLPSLLAIAGVIYFIDHD